MQLTTMQPSFRITLPYSADESIAKIRAAITAAELDDYAISAGLCAEFFVAADQRRFWSPHLSLQTQDSPDGAELVGRFSPRPEVWTLVMFVYFMMVFAICGGAILGWSQWFVNESPWGLWAVPFGILVIVLLHIVSLVGQRLSKDQMIDLRDRLNQVLKLIDDETSSVE